MDIIIQPGCASSLVVRRFSRVVSPATDRAATVSAIATSHGLRHTGETTFAGAGNAVYQLFAFTLSV
jgi:hypothetical protein